MGTTCCWYNIQRTGDDSAPEKHRHRRTPSRERATLVGRSLGRYPHPPNALRVARSSGPTPSLFSLSLPLVVTLHTRRPRAKRLGLRWVRSRTPHASSASSAPPPTVKRAKRATLMFSPSLAVYPLTNSSTVMPESRMYGCSRSSLVLIAFSTRPLTIFSMICSGFPCRSSLAASIFFSFSIQSAEMSSLEMASTVGHAAICMASDFASSWNSGRLATKSVSQFTSTMMPSFAPVWMYVSMMPSLVARPDFFSADARPFFRRDSVAASMSPSLSISAFLQSIMPAPVASRRVFTVLASTATAATTGPDLLTAATAPRETRGCGWST
mmetsp:Transcript_24284/g.78357  ORF Transcript_24284/g.78357 Transcript_24284/m.78357 type:complete len:326 (-) Transcript_24284:82-1059(-)